MMNATPSAALTHLAYIPSMNAIASASSAHFGVHKAFNELEKPIKEKLQALFNTAI
ncbi:hypothetical protein PU629_14600 [Pullulanibacillus sp. KACC 23026]|uniref:hypothetical protein n=1 Tax=Pullulanibacillus sp. KACC 23026 TaxID=3028315 RepID=UPI0023AFD21A|nr:hypothetical protein [Pullulanibacillus sp. KACC 23026]WEG11388.1 hypothetical protein PU629_14600 [Pullulanibacillus sp. KACC 23026]